MVSQTRRPVLMSIVQYTEEIESKKMRVPDLVGRAKSLGVDGVELRRELWAGMKDELADVRGQLADAGLLVTFATHSVLFCEGPDRAQVLADVDTAAEVGSPLLRIFSGPVPAGTADPAWGWARQVVDHAASRGIAIALENYARSPGGTLAEIRTVLDRLPLGALKTNIDTGNYAGWKQDVLGAIAAVGSRANYVHVKDPDRNGAGSMCPGEGVLPMRDIFRALDGLPQRIVYCFEFPGGGEPDARIARSMAFMKGR